MGKDKHGWERRHHAKKRLTELFSLLPQCLVLSMDVDLELKRGTE